MKIGCSGASGAGQSLLEHHDERSGVIVYLASAHEWQMSAFGTKQTKSIAALMSANDP